MRGLSLRSVTAVLEAPRRNGGRLIYMDRAYVLPHRPDDCGVAMNSKILPSSHPQDAKCGQLGRSIPQPRQTLDISAALAQGSAARAAFGQRGSSGQLN